MVPFVRTTRHLDDGDLLALSSKWGLFDLKAELPMTQEIYHLKIILSFNNTV